MAAIFFSVTSVKQYEVRRKWPSILFKSRDRGLPFFLKCIKVHIVHIGMWYQGSKDHFHLQEGVAELLSSVQFFLTTELIDGILGRGGWVDGCPCSLCLLCLSLKHLMSSFSIYISH